MADTKLSLAAALGQFDRGSSTTKLQKAAEQRNAFVEQFPAESLGEMELDDYALGVEGFRSNYSYLLEWGTNELGSISGGSASKHLVFMHKSGEWRYPDDYGSVGEGWEAVRSGLVKAIELASEGSWQQIDEVDELRGARAVRCKTAFIYFPDQLLPIYSKVHLEYWTSLFDVPDAGAGVVGRNRRLFDTLTAMPEFAGWSPLEIMHFLYEWAPPNRQQAILKIAPGEGAVLWDDCRTNGRIRVGWEALRDLSLYASPEEIAADLVSAYGMNKSTATRTARALDSFRDLKPGDIVVANRGTKTVVGIGSVESGYEHDAELPNNQHVVRVEWTDTEERPVDFGSAWMPTIVAVSQTQYRTILNSGAEDSAPARSGPPPAVPEFHVTAQKLLERNGELIFFGPPGTGKTFSARRHAAWLLAGGAREPDAGWAFSTSEHLREIESTLTSSARRPSWVAVANPSHWSWSQLLESGTEPYDFGLIKRNFKEVAPGDVVYGYEATPTKRIVAIARVAEGLRDTSEGKQILLAAERAVVGPTWDDLKHHAVLADAEPVTSNMQGTLFRLEPPETDAMNELLGLPAVDTSPVPPLTRVTFHPTYSYEDFIEGYKPTESGNGGLELTMRDGVFKRVCDAASAHPEQDYVLLIDEINRGNVPKIFGELITLIEKDKRGIPFTLPQSGRSFVVPPNVYILATMNTADRSIHVLDAALRRRFGFVELLPDPTVLAGASVGSLSLDEFLTELNVRIRDQIGREKQVGHSVLMNGDVPITSLEDFALAFEFELLPLLQEYTYGNYRDLADLVGDDVIDRNQQITNRAVIEDPEQLVAALTRHIASG